MIKNVEVLGLQELAAALKALPAEVASKRGGPLGRALRKGANVIRDEAQNNAPVDEGRLKKAIISKRNRNPDSGVTEQFFISVKKGKNRKDPGGAYYASMVEFGTELKPAHPYLRPAYESKKEESLSVMKEELAKGIARAARKAAKLGLKRG